MKGRGMSARADRFEDLIAWQKSRGLAREVYKIARSTSIAKDFVLRDQMTSAARSVMANIAEGFERSGSREFHKGLSIAKGSCAEVRSDFYLALDAGYLTQLDFERLSGLAEECSRVIAGLRKAVERNIKRESD